jgi:hypothetical protein
MTNSIESINIYNRDILDGDYIFSTNDQIHTICINIPHIDCKLYHKKFYVQINKNSKKLKMCVVSSALSKELIYFLDNIPNNVDILKLNEFVIAEKLTNLPPNLKKLVFCSCWEPNILLLNKLKEWKIPHGLKIHYKMSGNKFEVKHEDIIRFALI